MLSCLARAPSLRPIVVYVVDDPKTFAGDAFTAFLDSYGVGWLPHRPSFRGEAAAGRPSRALAWVDAAGVLLALGLGGRALVTRAEVLFAGDVDLRSLELCAEARVECATRCLPRRASRQRT